MTVRQLLSDAADHMEKYGKTEGQWIQRRRNVPDDQCPSCAMGAMTMVLEPLAVSPNFLSSVENRALVRQAELQIASHLGLEVRNLGGFGDVVDWSDNHTQDEVVAGLRAAAAAAS